MITGPFAPFKRFVKRIASPSNPLIKTVRRLAHPRRRESRFLIEGEKLVRSALECGLAIDDVLLAAPPTASERTAFDLAGAGVTVTSERIFRQVSSVESPDGILAIARRPVRSLDELSTAGFVLVSAGIQDPGNLGAIARVAEAAGASALAVVKGSADPFGPKAVRGSMGSLFRVPVFEIEDPGLLASRGFRLAALVPRGGTDFRRADWTPPLAILLGGEGRGLTFEAITAADLRVTIPMAGAVESLNVATAAALVLYQATGARPAPGSAIF
jgi:RNA methyltransferase, TrmH family